MANNFEKIFRGSYKYLQGKIQYSDENFTLLQNVDDLSLVYKSEVVSRAPNGEFLKMNVTTHVNQNYQPIKTIIERRLGEKFSKEIFTASPQTQRILYSFQLNGEELESVEIMSPGRYMISTPSIANSFIFSQVKKFDSTSRNRYALVVSDNVWSYEAPPRHESIYLEGKMVENDSLIINEQELKANLYLLFSNESSEEEETPIKYYVSKHFYVPYLIEGSDDTRIQVQNLVDLRSPNPLEIFGKEKKAS